MTGPARGAFQITDEVILTLEGELDISCADRLTDAVERVASCGASLLVIDLSGLAFIDSTGVRSLLRARELCAAGGRELLLIPGAPHIQRIFEVSGLNDVLPFLGGGELDGAGREDGAPGSDGSRPLIAGAGTSEDHTGQAWRELLSAHESWIAARDGNTRDGGEGS